MNARNRLPTLAALVLALTTAACDSPTDTIHVGVPNATIEAVGDAMQLTANVRNSDRLPEWESLNPEIVTVTRAGMAVGVVPGTARVRARVGSQATEGNVTVLPSVEVRITSLSVSTNPSGQPQVQMQLRNTGGRGYYKIEFWQTRESPGSPHRRVLAQSDDSEARAGMDVGFGTGGVTPPHWVIVYSRDPHSTQYRMTACVRADGGSPCPMP